MKRKLIKPTFLLALILFNLSFFHSAAVAVDYQHQIKLKKMSFSWSIKGEKLYVKITGATKGWVGIGFNPSLKMKDANYVLGFVKKGKVSVTDAFGVRNRQHIDDTALNGVNNVADVSGREKGKSTTIEFSIPMNTDDPADGKLSKDGYTNVLLAYGKGKDNFKDRHRYRTSLKVNLSTGQYQ